MVEPGSERIAQRRIHTPPPHATEHGFHQCAWRRDAPSAYRFCLVGERMNDGSARRPARTLEGHDPDDVFCLAPEGRRPRSGSGGYRTTVLSDGSAVERHEHDVVRALGIPGERSRGLDEDTEASSRVPRPWRTGRRIVVRGEHHRARPPRPQDRENVGAS